MPLVYVKVGRRQGSEALTSMAMLPSISALEQLLNEQGADIWVLDVQLVSPTYLKGSDGWKMERLLEVRETVDDLSKEAAYVYSLEGGHIYTEALGPANPIYKIFVSFFRPHQYLGEHETNTLERLTAASIR